MRILIADDEEVIRTSLQTILTKGGHDTVFALDGEEAAKKATTEGFDLMLLDLDMPKLTGYEVLKQVRATNLDLPVIFITGIGAAAKITQAIAQYKLNGFIEKPFTPEQVIDIVNKAVIVKRTEGSSSLPHG